MVAKTKSSVNDLLSVKKEIVQGSAESLVPILYTKVKALPLVVEMILTTIRDSVNEFNIVSTRLLDRYEKQDKVSEALAQFVDGCRYSCTGNLSWRYTSCLKNDNL